MLTIRNTLIAIIIASPVGLTACSSGQQSDNQQSSSASLQSTAPNASAIRQHYQATLSLQGEPGISADGKSVVVTVSVANTGTATFGSKTTPNNVNLAAHSVDATGKIIDNDLARGHLPQIAPGAQAIASILLPIDKVLNKSAELLPVQEGIGWFDAWGTKSLRVGPFNSCSNAIEKVCDDAGKPLQTITEKQ
ncbi:MAG: hypothetical protein ABI216_06920 [Devosia sp.]